MENTALLGKQKRIERNALIVSSITTFIIAGAGLWVFIVTKIQALFVDSVFSLIVFISSIFAVVISKASKRKTKTYPNGHYFLEPLYAILKSLFVLTLLIVSIVVVSITAYEYFAHGVGEEMNIAPVLPYTVCMVVLCFGLGTYNKIQNKRINNVSTILTAESKSNFVDGIMSAGVGVGILLLYLIDKNGALGFLHYTGDFFITVLLALLSLKSPIKVLFTSFKELSGAATKDKKILSVVNQAVDEHIGKIVEHTCDIFKIGMHINICVTLPKAINNEILEQLNPAKENVIEQLKSTYESIELSYRI